MPKCPFCEKPISLGTTSCPYCRAPITGMQPPSSDDLEQRVRALLDQHHKIEAIKVYREETGASLLDAKNAVEAMEAGRGLHVTDRNIPEGFEGDVLRLLSEGKKIQAIKLYREQTGVGLKDAKEAVEAQGKQHGIDSRGSGCLGVAFVLVTVVIATIVFAGSWAAADEVATISAAHKDGHGFLVYEVESEFQSGKTLIRVLLPERLEEGRRYQVIYVLPVEAGTANRFGDGLIEVKKHDLHNKHGVIFVAPTFSHWPWYADHPTDKAIGQESYFISVVLPFIEKTA